jgi:hypothetical protein
MRRIERKTRNNLNLKLRLLIEINKKLIAEKRSALWVVIICLWHPLLEKKEFIQEAIVDCRNNIFNLKKIRKILLRRKIIWKINQNGKI